MNLKDKFVALVNAVKTTYADDHEMLEDAFSLMSNCTHYFSEYVDAVYNMEVQMTIAQARLDGEEFRAFVQRLDTARRIAHEAAIAGIDCLNRQCDRLGVDLLYAGGPDRNEKGDFCLQFVSDVFNGRWNNAVIQEILSA